MKPVFKVLAGGAVGVVGLGLAGYWLASRSTTKRSPDNAPGFTARRSFSPYSVVGDSVTIARPREELFSFWRDFSNLARFMENVEDVRFEESSTQVGQEHYVWTIRAPGRRTTTLKTKIVREEPGELIAWRSIPESDIDAEGRITFEDAPGKRGTRAAARIAYKPPGGYIGRAIAALFLREPAIQLRHDLKRFKMLMEAGEIATSADRRQDSRAARQKQKGKANARSYMAR